MIFLLYCIHTIAVPVKWFGCFAFQVSSVMETCRWRKIHSCWRVMWDIRQSGTVVVTSADTVDFYHIHITAVNAIRSLTNSYTPFFPCLPVTSPSHLSPWPLHFFLFSDCLFTFLATPTLCTFLMSEFCSSAHSGCNMLVGGTFDCLFDTLTDRSILI